MQNCPACGKPYSRLQRNWGGLEAVYIHAGADCIVPLKFNDMNAREERLQFALDQERALRKKRETQLQTIAKYCTGQIYLEEIHEYVELKAHTPECPLHWGDAGSCLCSGNASAIAELAEACRASGLTD